LKKRIKKLFDYLKKYDIFTFISLILSIVSIVLVFKFRHDQFAAIMYEKQINGISEVVSLLPDLTDKVFAIVNYQHKNNELNKSKRQSMEALDALTTSENEILALNVFLKEVEDLAKKRGHPFFTYGPIFNIFIMDDKSDSFLQYNDVSLADFSLFLQDLPPSKGESNVRIGFVTTSNDLSKETLAPDTRLYVRDSFGNMRNFFMNIDFYIEECNNYIFFKTRLLEALQSAYKNYASARMNLIESKKALGKNTSEFNDAIDHLDVDAFDLQLRHILNSIYKNIIFLPKNFTLGILRYMFYAINLSLSPDDFTNDYNFYIKLFSGMTDKKSIDKVDLTLVDDLNFILKRDINDQVDPLDAFFDEQANLILLIKPYAPNASLLQIFSKFTYSGKSF